MWNMPAPYFDEYTQNYYVCGSYGGAPKSLLKFDKDKKWEVVESDLKKYL